MATGGFSRLKQSKSETKQRSSNWPRSVSSDKDDSLSLTSFPSDIRINNWDLSDLRPTASADSRRRKKSKGNPEREREQSLSVDSPPLEEVKQRTPSSLSRTRNTPTSQRNALEKLKQKLTYEEEQYSTDGERNNERALPSSRRRRANNREPEGASGGRPRSNRNNNTELPDRNQIVGRLVQIQDYIKQAASMRDTLQKTGDSSNGEDISKVGRLIANLREQEQGYLSLLQADAEMRAGVSTEEDAAGGGGGGGARDSDSEESLELEVESNAESENTIETSSSSRPRIESKLGMEEEPGGSDDSKDEDTAMDNTLMSPTTAQSRATALAARNIAETLNTLTRDSVGSTGGDLTAQQRAQLLRVMQEKQEQLRHLQSRQEQLLKMKKDAELKLQQAQARDNQARAALSAIEAGKAALQEEDAFLDHMEGQLKSNIVSYPESDDDEAANARESDPLSELQRQLSFLRNEFSAGSSQRSRDNREGGSSSSIQTTGTLALDLQQQQLQDKLRDLQQKKRSMDQLVAQLESLRSHRLHAMNNESGTGRSQPSPVLPSSHQPPPPLPPPPVPVRPAALRTADIDLTTFLDLMEQERLGGLPEMMNSTSGEDGATRPFSGVMEQGDSAAAAASVALSMQEAQEKLEKLHEVRQRLNQLRDLVQYYQKMKTQPTAAGDGDDQMEDGLPETAESELSSQLKHHSMPDMTVSHGVPKVRPGLAPDASYMQLQSAQAMAAAAEQSDEDNASASEEWGSGMGPWDNDPEVQEKVRKLMKAKEKLQDFQGLIAAIEAMPDGTTQVDLSQNSSVRIPGSGAQVREEIPAERNASASEMEMASSLPSDLQMGPGRDERLQSQMDELKQLREERERLLSLRQQLHSISKKYEEEQQEGQEAVARGRPEGSRKGDGDSNPPTTTTVTFASNDELYSKMRDQRIEREELRSKKKELEAIMKKDQNRKQYFRNQDNQSDTVSYTTGTDAFGASASVDATMATWGGSTVDNLENITEDEDAQDAAARQEDEDDGYPSDGIVQVEEEEEENETDNGTYTISTGAGRLAARPVVRGQGARPKTERGRPRGYPQPLKAASRRPRRPPQSQPWGRVHLHHRDDKQHREGQTGDVGADGSTMQQFKEQLEKMSFLCQNLINSPTASSNSSRSKGRGRSRLAAPASQAPPPVASNPLSVELQQASSTQQSLREMMQQQLMLAVSQCNQQLMMQQMEMGQLHQQLHQLSAQMAGLHLAATSPSPSGAPALPQPLAHHLPSQPYLSPFTTGLAAAAAATVPNNLATSVNVQSSRQTTFTVNPNFTSNPFVSIPVSQPRMPVSQAVQTADIFDEAVHDMGSGTSFPLPTMHLWEAEPAKDGREAEDRDINAQSSSASSLPHMDLQSLLKTGQKNNASKQSSEKVSQKFSGGTAYRPGLSAGISGSGFNDAASVSSITSSQPENTADVPKGQAEPSELGELNLFEELRDTIYTEVASLISQNESRPQYLLQIFTQLQTLTTDLMRQRAIFALQEIVQSTLSPETLDVQEEPLKAWEHWKSSGHRQDTAAAELTPSESLLTSDDDDIKARVRQHASALERKKQKGRLAGRGNSIKNDKFDYVEAAVDTSSMSTPTLDNGESPFARDSLGDTVIHLDRALAKMRREMQQAEQDRAERARCSLESRQDAKGDQGSESSVSDPPLRDEHFSSEFTQVDTKELDEQIKGVICQVFPVIKEHINDACSPQLLLYIQRLVLSLVRQPGHDHEFARFFYGQLASILQDSLKKFEGRRVREVGEDLLLEMSEVLFNELAFLRIMRDLEDPEAAHRMRRQPWYSPVGSRGTTAAQVGEDYDAGGDESDNESYDDKNDDEEDDDELTPQNQVSGMQEEEEEELGKDRDDELARKLVVRAGDDKDEDTEDPQSVHIQLAMSETKPFTRIGSDEDTEGSDDESLSLEDPSDTAVHMMEVRQDTTRASAAASLQAALAVNAAVCGGPRVQKESHADKEEKEADTSEADGTLEERGPADGCRDSNAAAAPVDCSSTNAEDAAAVAGTGVVVGGASEKGELQVNGHASSPAGEEDTVEHEVGLDDLPPVLNVTDPEGLARRQQEEDAASLGVAAIINSVNVVEELAGDGTALKEPDLRK